MSSLKAISLFLVLLSICVQETSCVKKKRQRFPIRNFGSAIDCRDLDSRCPEMASKGYCIQTNNTEFRSTYVKTRCRKSCKNFCEKGLLDWGIPQEIPNEATWEVVVDSLDYINNYVVKLDDKVTECKNHHKHCSYWASKKKCDDDPDYMFYNCSAACISCELVQEEEVSSRCPFDPNAPRSLQNGDLNELFYNITTDPYLLKLYSPTVLSQPTHNEDAPWIVSFEDFLTPQECEALIHAGHQVGYAPSVTVQEGTGQNADPEVSSYRTSTTAWCEDECIRNKQVQAVLHRVANLTGIHQDFAEPLQLLQYETGQYNRLHGDFLDMDVNDMAGPRVLTLLMYLNDVDEGGHTAFHNYNLSIAPVKGNAVLWPSVYNHNLFQEDERTNHESLPVLQGIKYASNLWLHVGNAREADIKTC